MFCYGTCFHRRETVDRLEVVVDGGARHAVAASAMPRPDLFHALHPSLGTGRPPRADPASPDDPEVRCYRSGFWATVPIEPRDRPGEVRLSLAARLSSGAAEEATLGSFDVVEPPAAPTYPGLPAAGLIAICMATFEPDIALFRAQIDSLRAQTYDRWICLISDDHSSPEHFAAITEVVEGDARFVVSRAPERAKFYRNFERALAMAPAEAELVALCDQDDRWYPEKLAVLREALGTAALVYSDQRLVDAEGRVLRDTMWRGRRNNHTDLASLLVANTITGAATLFRNDLLRLALPFPETPGMQFHDHWLGLVALSAGEIAYVDRPLYDYVQHEGAIFGDVAMGGARPSVRGLVDRLRGGRGAYFLGYLPREVQAQTLLGRCADTLTAHKRRVLRRFVASGRSPAALAWLALRSLRVLVGRNETLGSETELVRGVLWRWAVDLGARGARAPGRRPTDARYPGALAFEQKRLRRWRAQA